MPETSQQLLQRVKRTINEVTIDEASSALRSDQPPLVVDVRERDEFEEGAIKDALKKCHNFWMLVTPDSLRSEWVITEWASAWALDKNIVPVLFRCGPEELPARLRAYQSVDFHMVERAADSLNRKG